MTKETRQATCPRCSCTFNTEEAISSTLICPECMCVFTVSKDDSSALEGPPSQRSAADIVAENSKVAAKVISENISSVYSHTQVPSPSSSDETVISGSKPSQAPQRLSLVESSENEGISQNAAISANTADPADLRNGDTVDNYRVLSVLGKGAMGVVLKVSDEILDRTAAIKFMGITLAQNENCRDRFMREGKILASLKPHPNLVQIYSGGKWQNIPYFVMEYVEGMAFNEVIKKDGAVPLKNALKAGIDTARALDFVWNEAKLIHRDIKPANLMYNVTEDKTVVTDFGLAKPEEGKFDSSLTKDGAILGTPDYISPEQIRCEKGIDWRSDAYSLGCTLHHMICGKPPFSGMSIGELVSAHLKDPIPSTQYRQPACPVCADRLIAKMMAKDPQDRPESYDEILHTLNEALKEVD